MNLVAQEIAKETMNYLALIVFSGLKEKDIAEISNQFMKRKGVDKFWYYGVGSLVLVGKRTTLSISGREYEPSEEKVMETDLVTVDLSPEIAGCWGDYARSFAIENGKIVQNPKDRNLRRGLQAEVEIHKYFAKIISPDMTFDKAYEIINRKLDEMGYKNLDFRGNLGHTIEKNLEDRKFIENGNNTRFGEVRYFTFEPYIRQKNGKFGFKWEDIYYFQDGDLLKI